MVQLFSLKEEPATLFPFVREGDAELHYSIPPEPKVWQKYTQVHKYKN